MCDPVTLFIVGTGMNYMAQRQAQKRAERQIGVTEDRNDLHANKLINELNTNSKQYDATTRAEAQQQAEQQAQQTMQTNLNNATTEGHGDYIPTSGGNVGRTYAVEAGKRTLADANRASAVATMLAKLRAPTYLRTNEGFTDSNIASNMSRIARSQRAMASAGERDIASASVPNPLLTAIGSGMQGYGMYGMARGNTNPGMAPAAQSEYGPVHQGNYGPYIPRSQFTG